MEHENGEEEVYPVERRIERAIPGLPLTKGALRADGERIFCENCRQDLDVAQPL